MGIIKKTSIAFDMKKIFILSKVKIVFIILLSVAKFGAGQTLEAPKVQSPNAATFDKFQTIPVNLFTGIPTISVPIYTLSFGKIHVPIALNYHPGAVKATSHPGWVGTGWDLQSTGSITRQVRNVPDEYYTSNYPSGMGTVNPYYQWPNNPYGTCGSQQVDVSDWNTTNRLNTYFTTQQGAYNADVEADEFSFSFMGHSGKFYWEASSGWQVISDEKIKIQLNAAPNDFLSAADVNNAISQFSPHVSNNLNNYSVQSRAFNSFTLTTPDGGKYTFGGANAIEFYCPYTIPTGNAPNFIANSWLLTQIIDPNNNEVDFTYRRSYPSCDLFCAQTNSDYNCKQLNQTTLLYGKGNSALQSESGNVNTSVYSGYFHWPMYLSKITSLNETITFTGSVANCLRFSDIQLLSLNGGTASSQYAKSTVNNDLTNIQWEKLDKIIITDNNANTYKQYQLSYNNVSTQRLVLNSFTELDKQNIPIKQYQFNYNNISALPLYDGNKSDHWGFYNNKDMSGILMNQVPGYRATDNSIVTTGLLNKITYPTGGYSQLTWEAHDYSQIVSTDRASLISAPTSSYAGGSRIADISTFLPDNTLATEKKYIYKRGYTKATTPANLSSSGILNGSPQYVFDIQDRKSNYNGVQFTIHLEALNSMTNYSYNSSDSYIGYDEVDEVNSDGSYTKNYFTSYGTDLNNVSHFDQPPVAYVGWLTGVDNYVPFSSLDLERGKPVAILHYTNADVLVKKISYIYRNDAARFNSLYIKRIEHSNTYFNSTCSSTDALTFATANKIFNYSYYPISETETNFDQQGNNSLSVSTFLNYNLNNLITTKTFTDSKLLTTITNYTYPSDYSDAISVAMVNANILNRIITNSTTKNGSPQSKSQTTYYSPYTGIYVPQILQIQVGGNSIETRKQFYQYDPHGNLEEESKTNDVHTVYLWSYNSQFPVAKIQNSTYASVSQYITQAQIDNATSNDASMRTLFTTLRSNLPKAFITSYTYSPIAGITSNTDANGKPIYYEYDGFGRLSLLRDQDRNIVKKYCYNYAGQPTNCDGTVYNNVAASLSLPKSDCSPGYYTPGYATYTVPANKYTSIISQSDADQQAQNDIAANAQNYVNANSTCTVPPNINVTYTNTTSSTVFLKLTNTGSGQVYNFTLSGNTNTNPAAIAGQIQQGTYNAYMSSSSQAAYSYRVYSYTQTGVTTYSANNLSLCATCASVSINNYP